MSAAHDIATYVAATLAQGTLGTNVFVNAMFDSPDNQIRIWEYGGGPSHLGMGNANADALENVSIQIAVRNTAPQTAQANAYTIYKALDGKIDVTINSVIYLFMKAMTPPFFLERDEKERATFAFNLDIQKRRS